MYFGLFKKKKLYRVNGVMGIISCKATEMVIYLRKTNTKPQNLQKGEGFDSVKIQQQVSLSSESQADHQSPEATTTT